MQNLTHQNMEMEAKISLMMSSKEVSVEGFRNESDVRQCFIFIVFCVQNTQVFFSNVYMHVTGV